MFSPICPFDWIGFGHRFIEALPSVGSSLPSLAGFVAHCLTFEPSFFQWTRQQFVTTRWSLLLTARGEGPSSSAALDRLCQDYWPALFVFARLPIWHRPVQHQFRIDVSVSDCNCPEHSAL